MTSERDRRLTSSSHRPRRSTMPIEDMDDSESDCLMAVVSERDRYPCSSRRTGAPRCRDSFGSYSSAGSSAPQDSIDFFFSQACEARKLCEPSPRAEADEPTQSRTETTDVSQSNCDVKRNLVQSDVRMKERPRASGLLVGGSSAPNRLVAKSGTVISLKPPVETPMSRLPNKTNGNTVGSSYTDKGKGVILSSDLHPIIEQATPRPLQVDASPRKPEHRRLVRNGSTSPSIVAEIIIAEPEGSATKRVRNEDVSEIPGGGSSNPIHIVSPNSHSRLRDNERYARSKFRSHRIPSAPGQAAFTDLYALGGGTDRRAMHKPSDKNRDIAARQKHNVINIEQNSSRGTGLQDVSCSSSVQDTSEGVTGNSRAALKRKRKYSQIGESSSASFDDSPISRCRSSSQSSYSDLNPRNTSHQQGITLEPVIEVDEIHSLGAVRSNHGVQTSSPVDESTASSSQVESDEMLARQLQEQLYNELPVPRSTEEIDASLAWSLQQEESGRPSSFPRQPIQPRGRPAGAVRVRNSGGLRRRVPEPQLTSHSLEARLDYWEAMEAVLENHTNSNVPNRLLRVQRDFNENDYEMLLALDEHNQQCGASASQISRLPQSVVEAGSVQEACAVCLEDPDVGDTIRHLPCLHKFHKECIDKWLARKKECPICKSGIS